MKNKNERKLNCLNNSMQFSQKLFNRNLLQTDINIYNENEKGNNSKSKTIKNFNNNLDKSNILKKKKNKIAVNSNFFKNNQNIEPKNIFPDYILKTPGIPLRNKSIEKNINNKTKKHVNCDKKLNNSINGKNDYYSCHDKEKKEFKLKIKKLKKSVSRGKKSTNNTNNKFNRNLNLTITDFLSIGSTELKKNENDNINNHMEKSPEIIIKRKLINTTKNQINKHIFGNLNNNLNDNNSNISNNKSSLSNKITNNNLIQSAIKRKMNKKIIISSFSNDSSIKNNIKYSVNKKFDIIKKNLNDEINEINNNYNKIDNITEKENIKKNEFIFETIQNSFVKFIALLENPKEKEIAFNISQKFNDLFKKQQSLVNNIIKKNDDLNEKNKNYKESNKNIEKENLILKDKYELLNKEMENMKNDYNNNNLMKNVLNNDSFNNNLCSNGFNESNVIEDEDNESSVNTEELESIRFFDKIIMKKLSFSKANIPGLELKKIKIKNDENEFKENINMNNKNKNIKNCKYKKNRNKNFGLKKQGNKNQKVIGYSKIAEVKKSINIGKFRKNK